MKENLVGEVVTLEVAPASGLARMLAATVEAMMEAAHADLDEVEPLTADLRGALDPLRRAGHERLVVRLVVQADCLEIHLHPGSETSPATVVTCEA